jgi:TPR repeat protein
MRLFVLALVCLWLPLGAAAASEQSAEPSVAGNEQLFDRGVADYDAGDYRDAFRIFLHLAKKEDLAAMRNVALMKRKGLGCRLDPEGALEFLSRAARGGLPTAQSDLAVMLLDGEAEPPDPKAAMPWLVLAADAHHPVAEYRLGRLYEDGTVVAKDIAKARALYEEAAQRGVDDARARLAALKNSESPRSP